MARYELSDEHYLLIEPFLPINDGKVGHPRFATLPLPLKSAFSRRSSGAGWLPGCRAVC